MNLLSETLSLGCARWGLSLTYHQTEAFVRYHGMIVRMNEKMNLTSVTEPAEAARRHFLDSICPPALEALAPGAAVIDVGSGAGLPGIPLSIVRPDLTVTLLDARRKKVDFITQVIASLGLPRTAAIWGRAEELGRDPVHRERYDAAAARALAPLPALCEYLLPLVRVGGLMLAWKGASADEEIEEALPAIRALGGGDPRVGRYAISDEFCSLALVVCPKIRHTPTELPRNPGKTARNPASGFRK